MKFRYEYRTRQNVLQSDFITAKNRDAVYTLLSKRGIRPSRVEELPDPWRWVRRAALVLGVVGVSAAVAFYFWDRSRIVSPETRKQLYGDPVLIENGVAHDWADVFANPIDRYLARYAQPGGRVRVAANEAERNSVARELPRLVDEKMRYATADLMEHRQLRRLVVGIRQEAAAFLANGGAADEYLRLLDVRQEKEREIRTELLKAFEEAMKDAPDDRQYEMWVNCNRRLKSMGLMLVPVPERFLAD